MKKHILLFVILICQFPAFLSYAQGLQKTTGLVNTETPNNFKIRTLKSGKQKIKNNLQLVHSQLNENYGRNDIMDAWIDLFGKHERKSYENFFVHFKFMPVDSNSRWIRDTINHTECKPGELFYYDTVDLYGWNDTIHKTHYINYMHDSKPVICIKLPWGGWAVIYYFNDSDIPSTDINELLYYSLETNKGTNVFIRSTKGQKMFMFPPWNKIPKVVK